MPLYGPEDITAGFNAVYGPIAAQRKAEADRLAAEFLKLQIQNEPEKYQYERAYKEAQTNALNQKINLFSQFLGGGNQNTQNQEKSDGFNLDPSMIKEMFRAEFGLGPESPAESEARALRTHAQNTINTKNIEQRFPTAQVLTKNQEKIQGIEALLPLIQEIIEMPVPSQAEFPLPEFLGENAKISNQPILSQLWNLGSAGPNEQAMYQSLVSLAKDVGLKSQGLESNIPNLKTIEKAIARQNGESEGAYKNRMRDFYNKTIKELEHATGKKANYQPYEIEKKSKSSSNPSFVKMDKDGQKFNIPYDDVEEAMEMGYKIGR